MFSFFTKNKYITDFIPNDYVDIHSHIIPGIDDGAKTIEDSKYLLQSLIELGVDRAYTSPHTSTNIWNNSPEIITEGLEALKVSLPELTQKLDLRVASEYLLDDEFMKLLEKDSVLTYGDNHILVEFSYLNLPINFQQLFFEIQLKGYIPILAHPERYTYFNNQPEIFRELRKTGVKLQLNLLSLVGYYGLETQKMADTLLKMNLYDFTGTDLHHKNHLKALYEPIKAKHTSELTNLMQKNIKLYK